MKKRDSSLDLVRIAALFSVVSVHFFWNNGFYEEIVAGRNMYIMTVMRTLFLDCVPLFIVLTGFLMNKKTLTKKYYKGIIKTLETYLLACLLCEAYSCLFMDYPFSVKTVLSDVFKFTAAPYAWYIEMYIGLFLLIPFLNILYHGLKSKKEKRILLLTLILMVSLPGVVNIRIKILPFWWENLYPVMYYFLGCYLNEYQVEIKRSVNIILLLAHLLIAGSLNYYLSYQTTYRRGVWDGWGCFLNLITTILVFCLVKGIRTDNWNDKVKKFLQHISGLCLGGYLCSWAADHIIYDWFNPKVPVMTDRLYYYIPVVLAVFVLSLVFAEILECCSILIHKGVRKK